MPVHKATAYSREKIPHTHNSYIFGLVTEGKAIISCLTK